MTFEQFTDFRPVALSGYVISCYDSYNNRVSHSRFARKVPTYYRYGNSC